MTGKSTISFVSLVLLPSLIALLPTAAFAQSHRSRDADAVEPSPENLGAMAANAHVKAIIEKAKSLGPWPEQARWIGEAHQAMWQRNGWTSEADQYAMRLATAVESSPPWRLDRRLDTIVRMSSERYSLDAKQEAELRARVTRETMRFIGRFAPTIIQNFELFVNTRARGEPLDAQTVAQLVGTARPAFEEYLPEIDRIMEEFEETLSSEQREIFKRDRAAFEKRIDYVKRKLDDWAAGRWEPEEWGMDKDPLRQARGSDARDRSAAPEPERPASPRPKRPQAGPTYETAWELYVRQFIKRYELDQAQQTTARAILVDLQSQAAKYWEKHADEYDALTRRPTRKLSRKEQDERRGRLASVEAPINELFNELVRRLDRLPTAAQRRAAEASPRRRTGDGP